MRERERASPDWPARARSYLSSIHIRLLLPKVMGNSEFINQIATLHIMRSFQLSLYFSLFFFCTRRPLRVLGCASARKSEKADLSFPFAGVRAEREREKTNCIPTFLNIEVGRVENQPDFCAASSRHCRLRHYSVVVVMPKLGDFYRSPTHRSLFTPPSASPPTSFECRRVPSDRKRSSTLFYGNEMERG